MAELTRNDLSRHTKGTLARIIVAAMETGDLPGELDRIPHHAAEARLDSLMVSIDNSHKRSAKLQADLNKLIEAKRASLDPIQ